MNFLKSIFKKPVTIMFLIIIIIVFGITSASNMAVNLLPDISFPYLAVKTVYPGATASVIEETVTKPIELAFNSLGDVHNLQTYSLDNASMVVLQFEYGTNINEKKLELNEKLKNVTLPSEVQAPEITTVDLNGTAVVSLSMYSDTKTLEQINQEIESLEKKLSGIDGVESIALTGNPLKQLVVSPYNGLELLTGLLVQGIKIDSSYDIPLGEIEVLDNKIVVNNASKAKTIEEINNIELSYEVSNDTKKSFSYLQDLLKRIERMSTDDLTLLKSQCDNLLTLINTLEEMTILEISYLKNNYANYAGVASILEDYQVSEFDSLWSEKIEPLLKKPSFRTFNLATLKQIEKQINVNAYFLAYLQNCLSINPSTSKEYAYDKWNSIKSFAVELQSNPDLSFSSLYYDLGIASSSTSSLFYVSNETIDQIVAISKATKIDNFLAILNTLNSFNKPSNASYAEMLRLEGLPEFLIDILRSTKFNDNYAKVFDFKQTHQHSELVYDEETKAYVNKSVGSNLTSNEIMELYSSLEFDTPLPITLSLELLNFVRGLDLSKNLLSFKVSDVATVEYVSTMESAAYYNSYQAIELNIYAAKDANNTAIASKAKEIVNEFNDNTLSYKVVMLNNQADFINDSLSNALISLLIGSLLAVLIIYLFLRKIRTSLIIAISMPLSILLTLICLNLMGITLNMVSVGGIAVGIGMLVDNSIVVLESITCEHAKNKNVFTSSVAGVKTVLGSLIGSTLTSVCVFFPILFISGLTQEIFSDLAWAVIFSLSFSLLVAIIVIPTLYCLFFRKKDIEDKKIYSEGKVLKNISNFYINVLEKALKHKKTVVFSFLMIFIASIFLVFSCKVEFLPSIDQHKIQMTINYENTDDEIYCQTKTLEAYDILKDSISNVDYLSLSIGETGLVQTRKTGTVLIQLTNDAKDSNLVVEDIREALTRAGFNKQYEITALDGVVASLTGGISGVSVSVMGEDVDTLKDIASKIESNVITKNGIKDARDNMLSKQTTYNLVINKEALSINGLNYDNVVQTLRIGLASYSVSEIIVDDTKTNVLVAWKKDTVGNYYEDIGSVVVGFNNEGTVTLGDVASFQEETGYHVIRKNNGLNVIEISIETFGLDTNTASKYLESSTRDVLASYNGYSYTLGGVSSYLSDAFKGLIIALVIAFILLFGIMACLFESLRKPAIIILSFPFAFTGGFIALAITHVSLNVVSFIGLIMLMGVVINDAIILNERFDQLRNLNYSKTEAVTEGCRQRLRAVLMTSLTTILALIPMALGQGKGGALMQPLGIIAIGGLLIGGVVTLFLVPCVYSMFYRIKYQKKEEKALVDNLTKD